MAYDIPEFGALRRRLQSQFSQRKGEAEGALQRRFASQGMLSSGAYEKQNQMLAKELAGAEADATTQLDFAEAQEGQRRKELQESRDFAKSEREATQTFARGEREASQIHNKALFDEDMQFKRYAFARQNEQFWAQFKWQQDYAKAEFDESRKANQINALLGLEGMDLDDDKYNAIAEKLRALGYDAPLRGGKSNAEKVNEGAKQGWVAGAAGAPVAGAAYLADWLF